jgi:hypothetical protein
MSPPKFLNSQDVRFRGASAGDNENAAQAADFLMMMSPGFQQSNRGNSFSIDGRAA